MNKRFVLLAIGFLWCLAAVADEWYPGSLVLKNNKVLKGEISLRYEYDVVLFKVGREHMVYPAHKIRSFSIIDEETEATYTFISLVESDGAAMVHRLYEVVLDGGMSVLRRQRTVWYSIHLDEIAFDYFVRKGNEITSMPEFRRKTLPAMLRQPENQLSAYVRKNRLSKHRLDDLIQIINHYNLLQISATPLARN